MSFTSDINKFVVKTTGKLEQVARGAEIQLVTDMTNRVPVKTGRARGGTVFTEGSPSDTEPGGLDPGGGATIARATSAISSAKVGGLSWFLSNAVPYIMPLEFGHSKQAPAGFARIAAARFVSNVERLARELANR